MSDTLPLTIAVPVIVIMLAFAATNAMMIADTYADVVTCVSLVVNGAGVGIVAALAAGWFK